jgi:guanylate kinase
VSGPSGAGKSSVVDGLADRLPFDFSVSMTTRPSRPDEVDGVDYKFVGREEFEAAIASGALIEWAEYGGNLYGTPAAGLRQAAAGGRDILLDIEIVGARNVHDRFPDATLIWIDAPTRQERERRLRRRGDTSAADVERRLELGDRHNVEAREFFDYFVVNADLSAAIDEVVDILSTVPEHPLDPS